MSTDPSLIRLQHPAAPNRGRRQAVQRLAAALAPGLWAAQAGAAAAAAASAPENEPGYEWRPWPKGKPVPPLELDSLEGPRWRLAEQRGQVVLANFWASWCEPCRAEMPSLARLAQARAAEGLHVVAVNYGQGPETARRFMAALGVTLPVLLDRNGAAAHAWTPRIFPSTVVFDRRGRPAGVLVGEFDWESREAAAILAPLLAARIAGSAGKPPGLAPVVTACG